LQEVRARAENTRVPDSLSPSLSVLADFSPGDGDERAGLADDALAALAHGGVGRAVGARDFDGRGDGLDAASVATAMRGQDAVLCAIFSARWRPAESPGSSDRRRSASAIAPGAWARPVRLRHPRGAALLFCDKTRQRRLITASGVEWVIVRPGLLTDDPGRGRTHRGRRIGSLLHTVCIARPAPGVCWWITGAQAAILPPLHPPAPLTATARSPQ